MKWNVVLGILISAVFVGVIFYQVDLTQLRTALRAVHIFPLVLASVLLVFTHLIRAWRWRPLLQPVKAMPVTSLFSAIAIGFLANMLLPAHAGEVVRAYVIGRKEQVSTMAALATVVVARIADFVTILAVLVLLLCVVRFPDEMASVATKLKIGGYASAFGSALVVGSLWVVMAKTRQTMQLIRACLGFLPAHWLNHLIDALTSFAAGLQALRNGRQLVSILVLSACLWITVGLSNILVLHAFDLPLPPYAAFLILIMQTIGATIPSAPGFIGTYHAAVIAGLTFFGVAYEVALSVALVMHATFFFPFILVGLLCLWKESLSLHELWSVKARGIQD